MNSLKKIVFIAGMGYSGTTLLDLILGSHSKLLGLGEIHLLIDERFDILFRSNVPYCTCGSSINECEFWSTLYYNLRKSGSLSPMDRYLMIVDAFYDFVENEHILVDSSKHLHILRKLHNQKQVDLKVLFILKDVRSFTVSNMQHFKRRYIESGQEITFKRRVLNEYKYPLINFPKWYRANLRLKKFMDEHAIPYFQLGYEELCLYTEFILPLICKFLGLEYEPNMIEPINSKSHTILGNSMLLDKKKKSHIYYDNRWFKDNRLSLASVIFPKIMRFNQENVYSNTKALIWK